MAKNSIKVSKGEKVFLTFNYAVMAIFMFICLYPFYYVFIYSISDGTSAARGIYLFPSDINLQTYVNIFKKGEIGMAYIISVSKTFLSTVICIFGTSILAYLLTQKEMPFRKTIYRFIVITMYLNAGLIPWYITMKAYMLKDSYLLYIIPGAVNAYYLILVKTYMEQLPASLEESASIDGAGFFTLFFKIIAPLSKPIIATIAVYAAVASWNSWQDNYFLVNNPNLQTVQLILYNYLNEAQRMADSMRMVGSSTSADIRVSVTPDSVRMVMTMITVLPVMLIYPFLQKYFVKGIMMGAIKG